MTKFLFSSFLILLVGCYVLTQEPSTSTTDSQQASNVLKGATIRSRPYADEVDNKIEGFVVDLMDMISQKAGFQYTLYFSPDGRYGNSGADGNVTGMIGEVYHNRSDFAVADITVTEARERYVDFTEPFMINQLAALVKRDSFEGLNSLEDLVKKNDESPEVEGLKKPVIFGVLKSGATNYHLSKSDDPVAKKIYESMQETSIKSLVKDMTEGINRVLTVPGYAFIVESTFAEHEIAENCNLTMLVDTRGLHPRKFAIALPNGSPRKEIFDKAIKELISEGKIDELRHKYLSNNCTKPAV